MITKYCTWNRLKMYSLQRRKCRHYRSLIKKKLFISEERPPYKTIFDSM